MKFLLIVALMPTAALAQVHLCLDDKGRKTYTEAECHEIGMKPVGVINDIKPKSQRCYDLEEQRADLQEQANKLRAANRGINMNEPVAIMIDGQIKQADRRYQKECKR